MSVLLDIQGTQSRAHADRGIARYLPELAAALMRLHPEAVHALLLNPDLPPPTRIEPIHADGRLARLDAVSGAEGDSFHVCSPYDRVGIYRLWRAAARR